MDIFTIDYERQFDKLIDEAREMNKIFKDRQEGRKRITIKFIETEYELNEDNEFVCLHRTTEQEDGEINYMSFEGPMQDSYKIEVCQECDKWYNDIDETWQL